MVERSNRSMVAGTLCQAFESTRLVSPSAGLGQALVLRPGLSPGLRVGLGTSTLLARRTSMRAAPASPTLPEDELKRIPISPMHSADERMARHQRDAGTRLAPGRLRLKARHRLQRLRLAQALLLDQIGEQECEVDRLLGVQPRIAHRVIAVVEI